MIQQLTLNLQLFVFKIFGFDMNSLFGQIHWMTSQHYSHRSLVAVGCVV